MKYCRQCNALVEDEMNFCNICGGSSFVHVSADQLYEEGNRQAERERMNFQKGVYQEPVARYEISSGNVSVLGQRGSGSVYGKTKKSANVCGIWGFVFSLLALICLIIFFVCAVYFLAKYPEWIEGNIDLTAEENLGIYFAFTGLSIFTTMFTILSVIFSAIGTGHRLSCKYNGFAYTGLIIGCFCLTILFFDFGIVV